jgi:hypothetical protein
MFEMAIPVNRFLVPEAINGQCTAYVSTNEDDPEAAGRPVLYADNGDKPQTRKSRQEGLMNLRVMSGRPKGWRNTTFSSNGSIAGGSYIWFGVFSEYYWLPRFDYGATCYRNDWFDYNSYEPVIPDAYPHGNGNDPCNLKLSMYFTYTATSAQNHTRTLTQGLTLVDSRKAAGSYLRTASQNVLGASGLTRLPMFTRQCLMNAGVSMSLDRLPVIIRSCMEQVGASIGFFRKLETSRLLFENLMAGETARRLASYYRQAQEFAGGADTSEVAVLFLRTVPETAGVNENTGRWGEFIRGLRETARISAETICGGGLFRKQTEMVGAGETSVHSLDFVRGLGDEAVLSANFSQTCAYSRALPELARISETTAHWGAFIRGLRFEAGNMAETRRTVAYYRKHTDPVRAHGTVIRSLLIFIRLLTTSIVRDFLLRRFLKSNEELVLKSAVCREIVIESKV